MIALDLFAGTGWGVACQALGIDEHGVEIMPEAVATRTANGMRTIYPDVWEGLTNELIESRDGYGREAAEAMAARGVSFAEIYELLIASPPCQTFSMAGGGAGRKALDDVLGLIDAKAYRDVAALRAFGETHDPRTALVLTPLAHVYRDTPTFVVFEQVPPVLPVWERCAEEMRAWGYSVWVGILSAEQYGVPQTRKRAILIARADGVEAAPPTPTHSRYYSNDPTRLDPDVEPWVSMAEALGWGMTERPFITAGNAVGRAEGVGGSGGKKAIEREKSRGAWQSNHNTSTTGERYERDVDSPAPVISGGSRSARWLVGFACKADDRGAATPDGYRARDLRPDTAPAQHVTEKVRSWTKTRPATTVAGDSRVWAPGHKVNADDARRLGEEAAREKYGDRAGTTAERVTVAEAAALQSYPPGFVWDVEVNGKPITKTKTFLQIGNAVPPLLAYRILEGFLS